MTSLTTNLSMRYHVREMRLDETTQMIRYFLDAEVRFLNGMGVDPMKLPTESAWSDLLHEDYARPIQQRQFFYLTWMLDSAPIGHCNINKIAFGESAYMHLHIWDAGNRRSGSATQLLKPSIVLFFQHFQLSELFCEPYALNPAPNKTLPKAGFQWVNTYDMASGWINFRQPVNQWKLNRDTALAEAADVNNPRSMETGSQTT